MAISPLCTPDLTVKGDTTNGEAHPIRCKRWSCAVCAHLNRARVIAIAKEASPRALLTLTVSSRQYPDASAAAQALKKGLRLLRLGLSRDPKLTNFEFIAVFEKHKSGHPHLHLLIRGKYIPWQYLRERWEAVTGSTHIHITKISTIGQAAYYCAKYIGKDLAAFEGCKRWWRSHGYSKDVESTYEPDWTGPKPRRYEANLEYLNWVLRYEGFEVERVRGGGIRWRAPPDNSVPLEAALAAAQGRGLATAKRSFQ